MTLYIIYAKVVNLTFNTPGSITLPWDKVAGVIAPSITRSIELAAPKRHAVMISFVVRGLYDLTFCQNTEVEIVNATGDVLDGLCGGSYLEPTVYLTDFLTIRFDTTFGWPYTGFALKFSYHKVGATRLLSLSLSRTHTHTHIMLKVDQGMDHSDSFAVQPEEPI